MLISACGLNRLTLTLHAHARLCEGIWLYESSMLGWPMSGAGDVNYLRGVPQENIRNFSIIAHIDHGKSTLSDRLLQLTNTKLSEQRDQYMDKLQVERERGITVKAQSASLFYQQDGKDYLLNLIDTPGHVDFSYEVSRSLAACEGVILLIDASQGIEAQTLANHALATKNGLKIIPCMNKIDLPHADPDRVAAQVHAALGYAKEEILQVSGKTGVGVEELLRAVIERIPPPTGSLQNGLRALVFDTWYETFKGVVSLIRVMEGQIAHGEKFLMKSTDKTYEVHELGIMHPEATPVTRLQAGQVGYILCNMKSPAEARVGDTVCSDASVEALKGFQPPVPMVFAGIYPIDASDFDALNKAISKLLLNDTSVSIFKESSNALGLGFRCGFLGLLHMDVFRQRLEQEHNADIIITNPTVPFRVRLKKNPKEFVTISNPSDFPDQSQVIEFEEPVVKASLLMPTEHLGGVMELCTSRRARDLDMVYLDSGQVLLKCILPLGEIVIDFYDKIKGISAGYASLEYEPAGFQQAQISKVTFHLNGKPVDALTTIVHHTNAEQVGRRVTEKLKEVLDRQQFEVAVQAMVGGRVIARETIKAVRKNVLSRSGKTVGGGDVTRKKKLLEKQKEGKKKMKRIGDVELSQDAFLTVIDNS
ncbi:hypothetical protein GUITHDRAFT_157755 [Guillardia theta CCMP2712]|uniref:Translation factor GUF1 homolog, mitochondrial n=1 Tax=Guillardia theta (strain CCMP2712) TaxID=905079 RepID=L1JDS0_GUITC|nr:hypothetical protein GUITHDRAFT_157755 [Guillardia theta CCMP2712]EKX46254.1 hypothetical protein GUITHDRAFT_157755 [Guillardia theta CCMP2712]|eukprot:XP_005833234.1 hypothetical protein GUITHDRAFT_157755 [Guillardia theta CCMP2712]